METTIKFNLQFNHELEDAVTASGVNLEESKSFFELYTKLTNVQLMMSDESQPNSPSKLAEYILTMEDEEVKAELVSIMFVFGVVHLSDKLSKHMAHMIMSHFGDTVPSEMADQLKAAIEKM